MYKILIILAMLTLGGCADSSMTGSSPIRHYLIVNHGGVQVVNLLVTADVQEKTLGDNEATGTTTTASPETSIPLQLK